MLIASLIMAALAPPNLPARATKAPISEHFTPGGEGFVENKGQWNSQAKLMAHTPEVDMWVTNTGIVYGWHAPIQATPKDNRSLPQVAAAYKERRQEDRAIAVDFVGATGKGVATGNKPLPGITRYYKSELRANVRSFESTTVKDLYPGIDLVTYFDADAHRPRYDLVVHPGADPNQIRMRYRNAKGLTVTKDGSVQYDLPFARVTETRQMAYQKADNGPDFHFYPAQVMNADGTVGFDVAGYRKDRTLVIDPLVWSTYIGGYSGFGGATAQAIKVDSSGNTFVAGETSATDFPVINATGYARAGAASDVFLVKFDPSGNVDFSTVYGGDMAQSVNPNGIAIDPSGNVAICGTTTSTTLPQDLTSKTNGSHDTYFFAAAFNNSGSLQYTEFFRPQSLNNTPSGAITYSASQGSFEIASSTTSGLYTSHFSSVGPVIQALDSIDQLVSGFRPDSSGNLFVLSSTSANTSISSSLQPQNGNHAADNPDYNALIYKLSSDASTITAATYLGKAGQTMGQALAIDSQDRPIVTGFVYIDGATIGGVAATQQFPTTAGVYGPLSNLNNPFCAFVTKFTADLSGYVASTLIPSSGGFTPNSINLDANDDVYLAGSQSGGMPTSWDYYSGRAGGGGYICELLTDFSQLTYGTYFGNDLTTQILAMDRDGTGNFYLTGSTYDTAFPVTSGAAYPDFPGGPSASFVTVLNPRVGPSLTRITSDRGNTPSLAGGVGKTLNVSVYYAEPAGQTITLSSDNTSLVQINGGNSATHTVGGNDRVATFQITAQDVTTPTTVNLTATDGVNTLPSFAITVQPFIKTLVLRPTSVASGGALTAYVYPYEQPATDTVVNFTCPSDSTAISAGQTCIIQGIATGVKSGATLASVTVGSKNAATNETLVAGVASGSSASSSFTIQGPAIQSLFFGSSTTGIATTNNLSVTLTTPFTTVTDVPVVSNNPGLVPNFTVHFNAGATNAVGVATVNDYLASGATPTVTGTLTLNGVKSTASFQVIEAYFTLSADHVTIAEGDSITVQAGISQFVNQNETIRLTSTSAANLPGGSIGLVPSSLFGTVTLNSVFAALPAPKSVRLDGVWLQNGTTAITPVHSLTVTINPELTSIALSSTSVKGGTPVNGTVTLFEPYTGTQQITVSSNNPAVYFGTPGTTSTSFSVNTGGTSVPFTVNTSAVTRSTTVVLTFTNPLGYKTRTINLTLTP